MYRTHSDIPANDFRHTFAIWEPFFLNPDLGVVWTCVSAPTSYLTRYSFLPVPSYLTISFTVFAQFAYVFVVMMRASSTHFDGFDGTLPPELLDFEKVMEQASEMRESVERLGIDGARMRNKSFAEWAVKRRWAKNSTVSKRERWPRGRWRKAARMGFARVTIGDAFADEEEWEGIEGCGLEG